MGCRKLGMRGGATAALAAAIALGGGVAAASASAEVTLPVGEVDGVRLVHQGRATTVVFGAGARARAHYRRIAGKRISISCSRLGDVGDFGLSLSGTTGIERRAPRRRSPLRIGTLARRADYCRVALPQRTIRRRTGTSTVGAEAVVSIPVTQRGAVHLDEESKTILLFGIVQHAIRKGRFLPPARLLADIRRDSRARAAVPLVELATPADTPPAGKFGYYSDGADRAAVVTLSASGRRLFYERLPDDELRTNVLGYVLGLGSDLL